MKDLKMIRDEKYKNLVRWFNHRNEVVIDWNDNAIIDYPEDLVSYRDIGYLVNTVYEKAYNDAIRDLKEKND